MVSFGLRVALWTAAASMAFVIVGVLFFGVLLAHYRWPGRLDQENLAMSEGIWDTATTVDEKMAKVPHRSPSNDMDIHGLNHPILATPGRSLCLSSQNCKLGQTGREPACKKPSQPISTVPAAPKHTASENIPPDTASGAKLDVLAKDQRDMELWISRTKDFPDYRWN